MKLSIRNDNTAIEDICSDLEQYGVVHISTVRPRFREITDQVEAQGLRVISFAVEEKGEDGDFHYFIWNYDGFPDEYDSGEAASRLVEAIQAWRRAGATIPHVVPF